MSFLGGFLTPPPSKQDPKEATTSASAGVITTNTTGEFAFEEEKEKRTSEHMSTICFAYKLRCLLIYVLKPFVLPSTRYVDTPTTSIYSAFSGVKSMVSSYSATKGGETSSVVTALQHTTTAGGQVHSKSRHEKELEAAMHRFRSVDSPVDINI